MTNIRSECCEETGCVAEQVVQLRSASDAELGASEGPSGQRAGQQLPDQASSAGWSEPCSWNLSQEPGSPGPQNQNHSHMLECPH